MHDFYIFIKVVSRYFTCFMTVVNGILSPFSNWLFLVYRKPDLYMYFIMYFPYKS